jgi:DNA-binding NtrC family response regulator
LCEGHSIELRDLAVPHASGAAPAGPVLARVANLKSEVRALERRRIIDVLETVNGNQHAAARVLGISRGRLRRRLAQYQTGNGHE